MPDHIYLEEKSHDLILFNRFYTFQLNQGERDQHSSTSDDKANNHKHSKQHISTTLVLPDPQKTYLFILRVELSTSHDDSFTKQGVKVKLLRNETIVTEADSLRDGVVAFDHTLAPTNQNWIYSLKYEFYDHEITKSGIDLMKR